MSCDRTHMAIHSRDEPQRTPVHCLHVCISCFQLKDRVRADNARLKDENRALTRVIAKLKKPTT